MMADDLWAAVTIGSAEILRPAAGRLPYRFGPDHLSRDRALDRIRGRLGDLAGVLASGASAEALAVFREATHDWTDGFEVTTAPERLAQHLILTTRLAELPAVADALSALSKATGSIDGYVKSLALSLAKLPSFVDESAKLLRSLNAGDGLAAQYAVGLGQLTEALDLGDGLARRLADFIGPSFSAEVGSLLDGVQSARGLGRALSSFGLGEIGATVLTGGVSAIATSFLGKLFDFAGDQGVLGEQLAALQREVKQLRTEMAERFARVDARLNQILDILTTEFGEINDALAQVLSNQDALFERLDHLEERIDTRFDRLEDYLRASFQELKLDDFKTTYLQYVGQGEPTAERERFNYARAIFLKLATEDAFRDILAGSEGRSFEAKNLAHEMSRPLHGNLDYLRQWVAKLDPTSTSDAGVIGNVWAWAMGAKAWMELIRLNPQHPINSNDIQAIRGAGRALERSLRRLLWNDQNQPRSVVVSAISEEAVRDLKATIAELRGHFVEWKASANASAVSLFGEPAPTGAELLPTTLAPQTPELVAIAAPDGLRASLSAVPGLLSAIGSLVASSQPLAATYVARFAVVEHWRNPAAYFQLDDGRVVPVAKNTDRLIVEAIVTLNGKTLVRAHVRSQPIETLSYTWTGGHASGKRVYHENQLDLRGALAQHWTAGQKLAANVAVTTEGSAPSSVREAISAANANTADLRARYRAALTTALKRDGGAAASAPGATPLASTAGILRGREALFFALLRVGLGTTHERDDLQAVLYGPEGISNGCERILVCFEDTDPTRVWGRLRVLEQASVHATSRVLEVVRSRESSVSGLELSRVTADELLAFQSARWTA